MPEVLSFASGAAVSGRFLQERPEVARRVARAWEKATGIIGSDPSTREYLVTRMQTPADVAGVVPTTSFNMVKDLTPAQIADFKAFVDIAVWQGVVRDSIDVKSFIRTL
jgi:NitT/TauT family transport system substrate-binding protein